MKVNMESTDESGVKTAKNGEVCEKSWKFVQKIGFEDVSRRCEPLNVVATGQVNSLFGPRCSL